MAEPTIIVAALSAAVSLSTAAIAARRAHRDKAAKASASVEVARMGTAEHFQESQAAALESERAGHRECLDLVRMVENAHHDTREQFLAFRADHPNCQERMDEMSQRIATLEGGTLPPPPVAEAAE